jgi:kinesin family protein 5
LDNHRVKTNLLIREDKTNGIYIAGVTEEYATSVDELYNIMSSGALNRAVAATGMNEGSSRSHSVFLITVTQRDVSNATSKSGKLYLVDLAGSETVKKTNSSGQQLEEAKTINKSLSALGQVIFALTDEKSTHVPYRDSKLTRILQDSLGGNAKTVLIIAVSPSSYNSSESLSTLRFGTRAKSITNKVVLNATRSVEELEALLAKAERAIDAQQSHIMGLVAQLQGYANSGVTPSAGGSGGRSESDNLLIEKLQQQVADLQVELEEERQLSESKDVENQKLVSLLVEKDAVLIEAGGLMHDCQQLYEHSKAKCDVLAREKADIFIELQTIKAQQDEDIAKAKFEMQELEVTVETMKAENMKLRNEIAEMSGDDMRQERPVETSKASAARDRPTDAPTQSNSPVPGDDISLGGNGKLALKNRVDKISAKMARELDITGRHDSKNRFYNELNKILYDSNTIAADTVMAWVNRYSDDMEGWFSMAEDKFLGYEKGGQELARRIKDLEAHRVRLEKDLEYKTEKVINSKVLFIFVFECLLCTM